MWNKARHLVNVNADDAFTLVEIMIAMAMAGFVIAAVYTIFVSTNRSYHTQDRVADAQQRVRVGIDFMVRDIRLAGLDPLAPATDPVDGNGAGIKQATATKLRFTTDLGVNGVIDDGDGASPVNQERITYEFSANTLRRCLYEGTGSENWQILIKNVTANPSGQPLFTYLNEAGNPTATLADIRTVVIEMTVEGEDVRGEAFTRTLSARVSGRNL